MAAGAGAGRKDEILGIRMMQLPWLLELRKPLGGACFLPEGLPRARVNLVSTQVARVFTKTSRSPAVFRQGAPASTFWASINMAKRFDLMFLTKELMPRTLRGQAGS